MTGDVTQCISWLPLIWQNDKPVMCLAIPVVLLSSVVAFLYSIFLCVSVSRSPRGDF